MERILPKPHHFNSDGSVFLDNHHVAYSERRKDYFRDEALSKYKNHEAMQRIMARYWHDRIHEELPVLKPMSVALAGLGVHILDTQPYRYGNLERLFGWTDYMHKMSQTPSSLNREAGMFAEHYEHQFEYFRTEI